MPAYFDQGFMVREPAWHGLGVVLDEYPGREEAMRLAGHDFVIVEKPISIDGQPTAGWKGLVKQAAPVPCDCDAEKWASLGLANPCVKCDGTGTVEAPSNGAVLNVTKESYGVVQNDIGWDIVDAIVGEGAKYETGITLKSGAVCSVLACLPEPTTIPGDDSEILPWVNVAWSHDGSTSITARSTSIRTVCSNTQSASEAQGKRLGTDFTFRHTKKVMDRIEDAKMALQGVRDNHVVYMDLARELATIPVTKDQRELFVNQFLPMPPDALISDRVKCNVEEARGEVRALFSGQTIPEAHELTAYGLHLAGTEYLDHLRGSRSPETKFGRSLLRDEPAKMKLTKLIREVAHA
jgi:phage/plasmid-like protein (TIGR03299 family)